MMKNKKITINVPEPCHENWNQMTPEDKGRFCAVCSKTVIDFSTMSNTEVQDYFIKTEEQNICGRFRSNQLSENPFYIPSTEFKKPMSFQRAFVLSLISVMGSSLFTSCIMGKKAEEAPQNEVVKENDSTEILLGKIDERHLDSLKKAGVKLPPPPPVEQVKFEKKNQNKKIMGMSIPVKKDTLKK